MIEASKAPRGRFAPSPSGRLHWGNLRSSLVAWLQMRIQGGKMVLRIEDVDQGRAREELREAILGDLSWLGLDWDEGPDVGGAYGPYLQSQRSELYQEALDGLDCYVCPCSRSQIQARRAQASERACQICRRADLRQGNHGALRWPLPERSLSFLDRGYGPQRWPLAALPDDPILWGRDGRARYPLAVVVDDAQMHIDEVCRGADLLDQSGMQILLAERLYGRAPRFFHLPLVLGPDGRKLSKSQGAPDLQELRDAGRAPEEVIAALARSCGLIPTNCRRISARALSRQLELDQLYELRARATNQAQAPLDT